MPFYQKYQQFKETGLVEAWVKEYWSITVAYYERGIMFFPYGLLKYELYKSEESVLLTYVQKVITGELKGDIKSLIDEMMPALLSVKTPLTKEYIQILRALQTMTKFDQYQSKIPFPSSREIANYLKLSVKTVKRRKNRIEQLRLINSLHFVDMAQLEYETYLLIHRNPIPTTFRRYFLLSAGYYNEWVSIIQIPIINSRILADMTKDLDIKNIRRMTQRVQSWNLSQLTEKGWKGIIPSVDPRRNVIREIYDLDHQLIPSDNRFRKLTKADIKILDFFITKGDISSISELSRTIKISRKEVTKRLKEYSERKLMQVVYQYFDIGVNSLLCFISDNNTERRWETTLSLFPKVEIFFDRSQEPGIYFGYLKMPRKWFQQYYQKMDKLKEEIGITYQAKPSGPTDHCKWGISLAETYPQEEK